MQKKEACLGMFIQRKKDHWGNRMIFFYIKHDSILEDRKIEMFSRLGNAVMEKNEAVVRQLDNALAMYP